MALMTTPAELTDLPTFGRYQPLFRIAAGGMAEVYGARAVGEAGFQRWVALKRILPHLTDDARFVEMFLDEARLAANVQSAHVVPTLDLGRASDGSLYLVMELVVGATLANVISGSIRAAEPLAVPLAVEIVAQAAQGLHDAHDARSPEGEPLHIVHRDVSPRNILVGIDGRARILDFGIAQGELRATQTAIGEVKGTQAYFSPEQATLQKLDRRSDIYALGIVLYESLTGERLFRGNVFIEARGEVPRLDSVRADVPSAVADVIVRALRRDRAERYQTAHELALALRSAIGPVGTDASKSEVASAVRKYGASVIDRIQAGMLRSSIDRGAPSPQEAAPPRHVTTRLRAYGTSFIGRDQDLASLEAILAGSDRLVTLFGPPGVGKTRLAVEVGERVRSLFPGGIVFCDLADAKSADAICQVLGSTLGVSSLHSRELGATIEALGRGLVARGRTLVLLDNVEQVVAHVPATVGQWLTDAPDATFLVTSRERLRLAVETLYEVAPLDLGSGVGTSAAEMLFIDRATKVRRDLQIDAAAERAIATIVRRLDGLPLAIELAASRARVMDPAQLAEQVSERLSAPLLGARDANPRHATMDTAIRGSWILLSPTEQALFAAVSVFRGGFDALAAAEITAGARAAITAGLDPEITDGVRDAGHVAHLLEQLVDKSLVRFVGGTSTRFAMLESVREFAARELDERGAVASTMERFTRYFFGLAERSDDLGSAATPTEIERDLRNIVHAFRWTLDHDARDLAQLRRLLLLALATDPVLGVRGPVSIAKQLLEQAVSACDGRDSDADLDARARLALARLFLTAGDPSGADAALAEARLVASFARDRRAPAWVLLTEAEQHWASGNVARVIVSSAHAVEAGEEAGDQLLLSRAHFRWGAALHARGDHEPATEAFGRARSIARTLRYEALEGRVDAKLGDIAADTGDVAAAARVATEARAHAARVGDRSLEGDALVTLGWLALERDDAREAVRLLTRSAQLSRACGHLHAEGLTLCFVGVAQECAGLVVEARATLHAATESNRRTGNRLGEGLAQIHLGRVLAQTGSVAEAEQALSAGTMILREAGDRLRGVVARLCSGHLDLARAELAHIAGEEELAVSHRARAGTLARDVRAKLESRWLRSIHVRHALAVLEKAIETERAG